MVKTAAQRLDGLVWVREVVGRMFVISMFLEKLDRMRI